MNNINMIVCALCATLMLSTLVNSQSASTVDRNELGMGILYDMVDIFLGDVIHTKRISESFLNLSAVFVNGEFHSEEVNDWREWMEYLIGFSVCAAIGIVFFVAMPIIGFIFCCCRLCGRCGARPGKNSAKRAKCKRRSYCTVLTILTTITLAGIVCAFICNSLLHKHLQNDNNEGAVGQVTSSLQQIETFINTSVNGYSDYVMDVYNTTSKDIISKVNESATNAVETVLEQLHAVQLLAETSNISKEANKTKQALDTVSNLLSELSVESNQLKDNLTGINNEIERVCNGTSFCKGFNPSQYEVQADFSTLDKLSNESSNIAKALDMQKYIDQAQQSLDGAKARAHEQVANKITDAKDAIKDVEIEINKNIGELKSEKNSLLGNFPDIYDKMQVANSNVREYSDYMFYGGIGVCCAYLIVVVMYYIGILFGVCGEKPGEDAPCCNTGCGAVFLMIGVALTFIFSWILMIICVILFCTGGPVYTEACRYFQGHDPAQFKDFDNLIKNGINVNAYYDKTPPDFSISGILQNCQENKALFSALQLDYIIDLNKTLDISQLKIKLDDLTNSSIKLDDITIISGNLSKSLKELADSGLGKINFTRYYTELSKQLTVGDLSALAAEVEKYAQQMNNGTNKTILMDSAEHLRKLDTELLKSIKDKVSLLNRTLNDLQQNSTITAAILQLIDNLTLAQDNFNSKKDYLISDQIKALASDILNLTTSKIDKIKTEVRNDLYKCQNLSTALFTISDAVCLQVIEPVNGLWFSFGWCLFFFVPCLIFAVLLIGQYRRTPDDDKEFDDPNYMMYGGPNPDTIPLTSVDRSSGSSAYPRSGMLNAGYRDEHKRTPYAEPPPYNSHSGIAAYTPHMDQHHRQAKAYAASYGDGYVADNRANGSYSYPY